MFKFFFALIATVTMISMSYIGQIGKIKPYTLESLESAPVIIEADGSVSFPGRIPGPDTIYELRQAIQMEDVAKINSLLNKNHLFVAPGN